MVGPTLTPVYNGCARSPSKLPGSSHDLLIPSLSLCGLAPENLLHVWSLLEDDPFWCTSVFAYWRSCWSSVRRTSRVACLSSHHPLKHWSGVRWRPAVDRRRLSRGCAIRRLSRTPPTSPHELPCFITVSHIAPSLTTHAHPLMWACSCLTLLLLDGPSHALAAALTQPSTITPPPTVCAHIWVPQKNGWNFPLWFCVAWYLRITDVSRHLCCMRVLRRRALMLSLSAGNLYLRDGLHQLARPHPCCGPLYVQCEWSIGSHKDLSCAAFLPL